MAASLDHVLDVSSTPAIDTAVAHPPRHGPARGRRYARVSVVGVLASAVLIAALHAMAGSTIDPVSRTISDYALLPWGEAVLAAAVGCLLVASLATFTGLRAAGLARGRTTLVSAGAWCVGLLLVATCATDPPASPLTVGGAVHRYAAGVALFALPVFAAAIAREFARQRPLAGHARAVVTLAWTSCACLALFLVSHLPVVLPGSWFAEVLAWPHAYLGLSERVLFAVDLATLLVIASALLPRGRRGAS